MKTNTLRFVSAFAKHNHARHLCTASRLPTITSSSFASLKASTPVRPSLVVDCPSSSPSSPSSLRTMASKTGADSLIEFFQSRRSYYALNKELPVSKDRIQDLVKECLRQTPSSFNSQSNRVVVLFGDEHDKFWGFVTETLRGMVPADSWESTDSRMKMFKAAAGTVLFFDDQTTVEGMQAKFALYADRFPGWAAQSDAMMQFALWTTLEAEGLGANLQHYNPIVDDKVQAEWKIPATWKLNAQLVFGGRAGDAGPKDYLALEERYKVFGA